MLPGFARPAAKKLDSLIEEGAVCTLVHFTKANGTKGRIDKFGRIMWETNGGNGYVINQNEPGENA